MANRNRRSPTTLPRPAPPQMRRTHSGAQFPDGGEAKGGIDKDRFSFTARYVLSILVLLASLFMGVLFLTKGDEERRDVGFARIVLGTVSIFVGILLQALMTA